MPIRGRCIGAKYVMLFFGVINTAVHWVRCWLSYMSQGKTGSIQVLTPEGQMVLTASAEFVSLFLVSWNYRWWISVIATFYNKWMICATLPILWTNWTKTQEQQVKHSRLARRARAWGNTSLAQYWAGFYTVKTCRLDYDWNTGGLGSCGNVGSVRELLLELWKVWSQDVGCYRLMLRIASWSRSTADHRLDNGESLQRRPTIEVCVALHFRRPILCAHIKSNALVKPARTWEFCAFGCCGVSYDCLTYFRACPGLNSHCAFLDWHFFFFFAFTLT